MMLQTDKRISHMEIEEQHQSKIKKLHPQAPYDHPNVHLKKHKKTQRDISNIVGHESQEKYGGVVTFEIFSAVKNSPVLGKFYEFYFKLKVELYFTFNF